MRPPGRKPRLLLLLWIIPALACHKASAVDQDELQRKIESLRIQYGIPAVAYAVATSEDVLVQNVLGYRNNATKEKAHLDDLFHIGSLGKAVTALAAGKLVEKGLLSWEARFFDIFPEIQDGTRPEYEDITLKDLLSHRARLIPFQGGTQWKIIDDFEKSLPETVSNQEIMIAFAKYLLTLEPIVLGQNERLRYSNVGYQLAGSMIERASQRSWVKWIDELNRDLNARFYLGWPVSFDRNQPRGHLIPKEQGFEGDDHIPMPDDIKEFLNPHLFYTSFAGHISISMPDYVKFVQLHLKGLKGEDNYLKAKTYDFVLRGLPEYALGWSNDLYQSKHLHMHVGGFVSFRAYVKLIEEDDLAIVVFMNTGIKRSLEGLHEIRFLLQDYFLSESDISNIL